MSYVTCAQMLHEKDAVIKRLVARVNELELLLGLPIHIDGKDYDVVTAK